MLKVWLKVKKHGWDGITEQCENMFALANHFTNIVQKNINCCLINDPMT